MIFLTSQLLIFSVWSSLFGEATATHLAADATSLYWKLLLPQYLAAAPRKAVFDWGKLKELISGSYSIPEIGKEVNWACRRDLKALSSSFFQGEQWALKYIDSWAKPPAGIMSGNYEWYGDFDQCLAIEPVNVAGSSSILYPRYCRFELNRFQNHSEFETQSSLMTKHFSGFFVALCLPHSCYEEDLPGIVNPFLRMVGTEFRVMNDSYCNVHRPPMRTATYVAIFCFTIFGLFLSMGLSIDIYFRIRKPKDAEGTPKKLEGHFPALPLCFSPLSNFEKLISLPPRSNKQALPNLRGINAIRTLSLFWIVLGHTYVNVTDYIANAVAVSEMSGRFTFQFVLAGTSAVDSFFFLSGLLAYWSMHRTFTSRSADEADRTPKPKSPKEFLKALPFVYLHRYLRLTPAYAAAILFYQGLWAYLSNGPFYAHYGDRHCAAHWWTNLLYINNLVKSECVAWSWYLAIDMQLFIVAPFVVYPFVRKPAIGWAVAILGILTSIASSAYLTVAYDLPIGGPPDADQQINWNDTKNYEDYWHTYYVKPYNRMAPYFVGLICCHLALVHGHFLNFKIFKPRCISAIGWLLSTLIFLVIVYGTYGLTLGHYVNPGFADVLYNSFSRLGWGVSLGWLTLVLMFHHGGVVGRVLSSPVWAIPARLSYVAYLIHLFVLIFYRQTARRPFYLTDVTAVFQFCGTLSITLLLSVVFSLAFETPFLNLQKHFKL